MPILVICTCGKKFRAADRLNCLHAHCPACGKLQVVTGESVPEPDKAHGSGPLVDDDDAFAADPEPDKVHGSSPLVDDGDAFETEEHVAPRQRPKWGARAVVRGEDDPKDDAADLEKRVAPRPRPKRRARAMADTPLEPPESPTGGRRILVTVVVALAALGLLGWGASYLVKRRTASSTDQAAVATSAEQSDAAPRVRVKGSVTPAWRIDQRPEGDLRFHQWKLELELNNGSQKELTLGDDLFVLECERDGSRFEGTGLFLGRREEGDPSLHALLAREPDIVDAYGLSNYQIRADTGAITCRMGKYLTRLAPDPAKVTRFGSLAAGKTLQIRETLEQGFMLDQRLCHKLVVILPELRMSSGADGERYRLLASLRKPAHADSPWEINGQELVRVEAGELDRLVRAADAPAVSRVWAAHWLVAIDRPTARKSLVAAGAQLPPGQVLGCYLKLLANLKETSAAERALQLLRDPKAPSKTRRLAAEYLGAVQHEPARQALLDAARGPDDIVAHGATRGLASLPGGVVALLPLLQNEQLKDRHRYIASQLASAQEPDLRMRLHEIAAAGNVAVLSALADAATIDDFDSFLRLFSKERDPERRELCLNGLVHAGGPRLGPELVTLLASEPPPSAADALEPCPVARELIRLSSVALQPALTAQARQGNTNALLVLAQSGDDSVRPLLADKAVKGSRVERLIALNALATRWPKESVAVFATVIDKKAEVDIVLLGALGLQRSQAPDAIKSFLSLMRSPDKQVRSGVTAIVVSLPAERFAPSWLEALLATEDDQVAADLVKALSDNQWKDAKAVPRLMAKLRTSRGDMRFQMIRLLQHVTGDDKGPANYFEFQKDPERWTRLWENRAPSP
jgi:hypothetical protein